ncbi:radical SAM family heme chaperone HemW [Maricaulis maris]|uniref:Heme chaperone HemW n=1 Tax=Maricaulis maris TaxID=74318 RepID=A0A495D735_9PROT|nr:radical SAM family heme chaperone HemW [Maricaulis maris]RKQ96780.1 anaerobic coproporphyrinogen III oxidase [Maricaulis maris]
MTDLGQALGLYLHWPYCARICPYCDFNVYRPKGDDEALLAAILDDMADWRERTGPRALASLHFGGGTPSLMKPDWIARVIEAADRLWGLSTGAEIGLEANPNDQARFAGIAQAGVGRLSLGVQSFDDAVLAGLGRDHDGSGARQAIDMALSSFDRVSVDMIYAHAGQTLSDWRTELGEALATGAGHISAYQLTIEPGTAFGKRTERGETLAVDGDSAADLYELTGEMCEAAGFPAYEVSNHARSDADRSTHNRIYWEGGDWIGVGPGAHGRLGRSTADGGRIATTAARRPSDYIAGVATRGSGVPDAGREQLSPHDDMIERAFLGLRITDGLDLDHLAAATGCQPEAAGIDRMIDEGFLARDGVRIRLTPAGRLLADRVTREILP